MLGGIVVVVGAGPPGVAAIVPGTELLKSEAFRGSPSVCARAENSVVGQTGNGQAVHSKGAADWTGRGREKLRNC